MTDILPCPFCGSTDISFVVRNPSYGECADCLTEGPSADRPTDAMAAWNRRVVKPSGSLPYRLRPPRGPRGSWALRATYKDHKIEMATYERDEAAAWVKAAELWDLIKKEPGFNLDDRSIPGVSDLVPEVMPLGPFEHYMLDRFGLRGEEVIDLGTGKTVLFHAAVAGYRQAIIPWRDRKKRVLEHRVKFLLCNRWLPRSVDHINRVRNDNALANLRAATPLQQSKNRGMIKGKNIMSLIPNDN